MKRETPSPPGIEHLNRRLQNWGLYHSRDRGYHTRARAAGSAEGRYMPERLRGDTEADRRSPAVVIDIDDALIIDTAWRRILVRQHRMVIRWWYVDRHPAHWILRRVQMRGERFTLVRLAALVQLQRQLDEITR